ncbi:GIY-YIG nuclease family protein [Arthrobacter psychrochitiniphilus]|uniref:GIY-YIG nuclease family protein n=1 Tax=Arthrobacter psychrochitiniphilus TaxID=291045 RepID=UPI003F7BBCA4
MDRITEVGALRFQNWPVFGVQSLAFRFEPEDSRTGIYILSFANGERYVGKSLNVVNRFSTHRRRWEDITHLAFRPFVAEELKRREREVLASVEQRGYRVRNLDLAGRPGGDSLLNIVMEEQAQADWLESDASEPFDAPRYIAAVRRVAGLARFQELSSRSDFPELLAATANYVATALPWPSQTEGRFWTATAMASTGRSSTWRRLIAISAQNAEVLVIGESSTGGATVIEGFINLDKCASSSIQPWLRQQVLDVNSLIDSYGTIGDVCHLEFTGLQTLSHLLEEGGPITQLAKELALNLMRKGPSMYARFHNDHLADAIFSRIADQNRI